MALKILRVKHYDKCILRIVTYPVQKESLEIFTIGAYNFAFYLLIS